MIEELAPVSERLAGAVVDAGDLALDLALGAADSRTLSGRRLIRASLVLIVLGVIIGGLIWRRRMSSPEQTPPADS
jgi:hypothetical protein